MRRDAPIGRADTVADGRAEPRVSGMIRRTGPEARKTRTTSAVERLPTCFGA